MSIKEDGRDLKRRIVRDSAKIEHGVRKNIIRAGTSLRRGATIVVRDVERTGKQMGKATRSSMARASARIKSKRRARN
jgi:hypothetical protein